MDKAKQKYLDKIQKCLILAADENATEGERQAAETMAAKLMATHNIHRLEVKRDQDNGNGNVERNGVDCFYKGITKWEYHLGFGIATPFECKAIKDGMTMVFVGEPEDIESCIYFFKRLRIYIGMAAQSRFKRKGEQNDYAMGMVMTIKGRLSEIYKRYKEIIPSDCRDLVVRKDLMVNKAYKDFYPHTRSMARSKRSTNHHAYRQGLIDGKNVDLTSGKTRTGETKKIQ